MAKNKIQGTVQSSVSGFVILDLPPKRAEAEARPENGPTLCSSEELVFAGADLKESSYSSVNIPIRVSIPYPAFPQKIGSSSFGVDLMYKRSNPRQMTRITLNDKDIITLGLGLQAPCEITGQLLDTDKNPHELRLTIQAQRGTRYPCPICGTLCHAP